MASVIARPLDRPVSAPTGIAARALWRYLCVVGEALLLIYLCTLDWQNLSLAWLANLASLSVLLAVAAVASVTPRRAWSASTAFLCVYSVFHFGLTLSYGLGLPITGRNAAFLSEWFYTDETRYAVLLATIGLVACALGALVASLAGGQTARDRIDDRYLNIPVTRAGAALVACGVVGWFLLVVRAGGVGLLFGDYDTLNNALSTGTLHPYAYLAVGWGMIFLGTAEPSRLRRVGFAFFALWALVAFPLGLRGEVLFPLFAALVVAARRRAPFSMMTVLVCGICLLSLIAAGRSIRDVGLANAGGAQVQASPLSSIEELGISLRPVSEVVHWRVNGDPFIHGASYWAPFDRILNKFVPGRGWQTPPAEEDDRVMNQLAIRRVGPIGFSVVAEAYRNFGTAGVVGILFVVGLLLGWMDHWPLSRARQIAMGVVFLPLLVEVRNDFVAVPLDLLIGFTLLAGAVALAQVGRKRAS